MEIDIKKLLPQLVIAGVIGMTSYIWNGLQDVIQHQNACDVQVEILIKELDMLENNFNNLLFKLQG